MIKPETLQPHLDDYLAVTGNPTQSFVCPITGRTSGTLSMGHILNRSIPDTFAALDGQAVVQWNEVDGHFGRTVEPDFIIFARMPSYTFEEYVRVAHHRRNMKDADGNRIHLMSVILPDGRCFPLIRASGRGKPPLSRKVIFKDDNGNDVEYYIVTEEEDLPLGPATVNAVLPFRFPALVASMWKAGFLTLFKIFGYAFVFSRLGEFVRKPLRVFVEGNGDAADAADLFDQFCNSFNVFACSPAGVYPVRDTLRDGALFIHCRGDEAVAMSVLFDVKGSMLTTTFPHCPAKDADDHVWDEKLKAYHQYLADPNDHNSFAVDLHGRPLDGEAISIRRPRAGDNIPCRDLPPHLRLLGR